MPGPRSIIGACAVRVSRLDADGTPDFDNAVGALAFCGGISSFAHDFEIESGVDIFERDGCGNAVVIKKTPDLVKRSTFTLTMAKSSPQLSEILGVAVALNDGPDVVGFAVQAAAGCEAGSQGNGVSIELWSEQWDCADAFADAPYVRAVLPRAFLVPKGYTRQNGVALPVYEGFSQANNNYGDGPFGDLDPLVGVTDWVYAELDDDALPPCADEYLPTPSGTS